MKRKMSVQQITEMAIEMTILDAIENGHTNTSELVGYMGSEIFAASVASYSEMFKSEF
jgi:hypothetical protein